MAQSNKSSYSFRLTKEDDQLREFLEQIPDKKRSEAIRFLLGFAYRTLMVEKERDHHIEALRQELVTLRKAVDARFRAIEDKVIELVSLIPKTAHVANTGPTEGDKEIPDEALQKSAQALLSSFGFKD